MNKNNLFRSEQDFEQFVNALKLDLPLNQIHRENLRRQMLATFSESAPAPLSPSTDNHRIPLVQKFTSLRKLWTLRRAGALIAAAAVFIAVFIGINHFGGSTNITTIAFADISAAMQNVPWQHSVSKGFEKGVQGTSEQWIGFASGILAFQSSDGKVNFFDNKTHKRYAYDPQSRSITITYTGETNFSSDFSSLVSMVDNMLKRFENRGADITTSETKYQGQKVQLQEISLSLAEPINQNQTFKLYIQPDSKLLLASQGKAIDAQGNIITNSETTYSYPPNGPADIYALGVPRDAAVISNLPTDEALTLWDKCRQSRAKATNKYVAIITHTSGHDFIDTIDVDFKDEQNHRLERHFVFNSGQPIRTIKEYWPQYKEQLGESLESLLAWTKAHYNNTGHISIYLYDGQYNASTHRDDTGIWSPLKKNYSPAFESMPEVHLGALAWPVYNPTGSIIEDDYAEQNGLICVECLQQGDIHSGDINLPGRILYYLDPRKDYMCRRRVIEWRPDAEWQKDKNWLVGIAPEKIMDGSIHIIDITEFAQAANGHWYPKIIEERQSGIRQDYREAPLKTTVIKRVYLQIPPEFPESIFDPNTLPH
jgi:hypothetical protein